MSHAIDVIAPVIGPIFTMLLIFSVVYLALQHRRTVIAMKHKTMLELIERGAAIPDALLAAPAVSRTDVDLRRGLVLVFGGIGFIAFALTLPKQEAWGFGLFLIFTGLGFLLTWRLSRPNQAKSTNA